MSVLNSQQGRGSKPSYTTVTPTTRSSLKSESMVDQHLLLTGIQDVVIWAKPIGE